MIGLDSLGLGVPITDMGGGVSSLRITFRSALIVDLVGSTLVVSEALLSTGAVRLKESCLETSGFGPEKLNSKAPLLAGAGNANLNGSVFEAGVGVVIGAGFSNGVGFEIGAGFGNEVGVGPGVVISVGFGNEVGVGIGFGGSTFFIGALDTGSGRGCDAIIKGCG